MKKFSIVLTICIIISMLQNFVCVQASAIDDLQATVKNGVITVSGTVDGKYSNTELYVFITKPDKRYTDIGKSMDSLAYFNSVIPDDSGNIELECKILDPEDNYYHLYVRGNDLYSDEPLCEVAINPVQNIVSSSNGIREDNVPLTESTVEGRFKQRLSENMNRLPEVPLTDISDEYTFLYVDKNAVSGGDGTINAPFNTIEDALLAVKGDAAAKAIVLREGVYNISNEIVIGEEHSGTKAAPLFITAFENEKVVITDGISIPKTAPVKVTDEEVLQRLNKDAAKFIYEIDMQTLGIDTSNYNISLSRNPRLCVNDYELSLARYPENTTVTASVTDAGYPFENDAAYDEKMYDVTLDDGFELKSTDKTPSSWKYTDDIWMHGIFAHEWMRSSYRVSEAFTEFEDGITIKTDNVPTFYGNAYYARTGDFYYFNILEELNSPGEWVCDKTNQKIYFYPPSEYAIEDIVLINGSKEQEKVHYGAEVNKNLFALKNSKHVVIDGILFKDAAATGVYVENGKNIKIQQCKFKRVANGCDITANISDCGVIYSEFLDINNVGVRLDEKNYDREAFPKYQHNYLQNCILVGSKVQLYGVGNLMSHNTLSGVEGTAVNIIGQENIVEYNEISGAPYQIQDAGAVYLSGYVTNRGNLVRYNYIHDFFGMGIYFDDRSSDNYAYGNILSGSDGAMFHIHSGSENVFSNNIVFGGFLNESMNYYSNPGWPEKVMTDAPTYLKDLENNTQYDSTYDVLYTDIWQARYPGTKTYLNRISSAYQKYLTNDENYKDACKPYNNVFYNNALVGAELGIGENRVDEEDTVHDNIEISNYTLNLTKESNYNNIISQIQNFETIDFTAIGADTTVASDDFVTMFPCGSTKLATAESMFLFNKVAGASRYTIEVSKTPDFSRDVKTFSTLEERCLVSGLEEDTNYYWRVCAVIDEVDSVISQVQEFTTARHFLSITIDNEASKITNEGISYSVDVNSSNAKATPMVIIVAAYGDNGEMLGTKIHPYNTIAENTKVSGVIEGVTSMTELSFFVWETMENMIPLNEKVILK